jgi:pantoate kinase
MYEIPCGDGFGFACAAALGMAGLYAVPQNVSALGPSKAKDKSAFELCKCTGHCNPAHLLLGV